jgi:hypothetical protein
MYNEPCGRKVKVKQSKIKNRKIIGKIKMQLHN